MSFEPTPMSKALRTTSSPCGDSPRDAESSKSARPTSISIWWLLPRGFFRACAAPGPSCRQPRGSTAATTALAPAAPARTPRMTGVAGRRPAAAGEPPRRRRSDCMRLPPRRRRPARARGAPRRLPAGRTAGPPPTGSRLRPPGWPPADAPQCCRRWQRTPPPPPRRRPAGRRQRTVCRPGQRGRASCCQCRGCPSPRRLARPPAAACRCGRVQRQRELRGGGHQAAARRRRPRARTARCPGRLAGGGCTAPGSPAAQTCHRGSGASR
mmetsp:Transcript_35221/g.90103  ORF Transcript_35221/g.90103 Transcript_35221/m.90103 type:complete len:268 (-) Transcript_35221:948-1751(-)